MKDVLISGAGIGGPTLAYWLARAGLRPTVVERAGKPRSSGSPVDVRGPAVQVAEKMGAMPALRAAAMNTTGLAFVDASGRVKARVPMAPTAQTGEVELPRGELATILYETSRHDAEYLWDDSIATLDQDAGGVDVTFESGTARRFDLVIGADGLHSAVRRLAFGPESDFVHHMGLYVATTPFDGDPEEGNDVVMFNAPGRAVSLSRVPAGSLAFFVWRAPGREGLNRDPELQRQTLIEAYEGLGWRVPEILGTVRGADDLYFDSVSQVRIPRWSTGRVALLGDAASCVSLFGGGSTLAMAGAYTLAEELAASGHERAFARYEERHRELVTPRQAGGDRAAALLVPATRWGIALRDTGARVLAPVAQRFMR